MKILPQACFCSSQKISYPASERNKSFILGVLQKHLDASKPANLLEISSGTGQHCAYFARHFPDVAFQPSECDASLFDSIRAYARDAPANNVRDPIVIDAKTTWRLPIPQYDYAININMMHVSEYACTTGLFANARRALKPRGLMVTYGAYAHHGVIAPQSNVDFDAGLRRQNSEWGLRDIVDLERLGKENGIALLKIYDLPANNKCLVWQRSD